MLSNELAGCLNLLPVPVIVCDLQGTIVFVSTASRALLQQEAGATLTDEAHERPWGIYSGYHLWEIIWNPRRLPPQSVPPSGASRRADAA